MDKQLGEAAILGINPRVLASVTSETPGSEVRVVNYRKRNRKWLHAFTNDGSSQESAAASKLFRDEEPKVSEGTTRSL